MRNVVLIPDTHFGTALPALVAELMDLSLLAGGDADIGVRVVDDGYDPDRAARMGLVKLRIDPAAFDHEVRIDLSDPLPEIEPAPGMGKRHRRAADAEQIDPTLSRQQRRLHGRRAAKGRK